MIGLVFMLAVFSVPPHTVSHASDSDQAGWLARGALNTAASRLPRLHSLLISQDGELVFEQYYNGRGSSQPANMKSASKSVISALVGIAIERGDIEGLDQTVAGHFPQRMADAPARKRSITIENLLTMQSGLETTSNRNYGRWVASEDWVGFALDQPMVSEPGTEMIYSTGSTHLLSAIIERASGMSTRRFAEQYLAAPLDINLAYWSQDPQGIHFGGNNLEMTPRDMLAFGRLYLNDGRYNGERILPREWIEQSFRPHADSPRGQGRHYGYGWWLRELAGMQIPMAWGYGGQFIFVIKPLDMVVVATSDSRPGTGRFSHLRGLYDLVEERILRPAFRQGP